MPPDRTARAAVAARALLLAPAYLWLLIAVLLPLAAMLYFSFLSHTPGGRAANPLTLAHYLAFVRRPYLIGVAWTSVRLALWTTIICALVGWPAALALSRAVRGQARAALFLLMILPFWTNGLVRIFSWTIVLSGGGLVDRLVHALLPGVQHGEILYSFPAIVIGLVHAYLPYMVLTSYVSLASIEPALLEAARSLGARTPALLATVLLPLSLPGLLSGAVLIFVPVLGSFMEPRILGGRVGVTLGTVIEDQFTQAFNWPLGAALSFVMLAVVLMAFAVFGGVARWRAASVA